MADSTYTSAMIEALRERAKKFLSLDTPQDQDMGDVAADVGAGFVPGVGTLQSARDLERARREGDGLGMGLAAVGLIPFAGGVTKGIGAARKGLKGKQTVEALRAAPRSEALETARANAVKMLGLPENNTAMDRAKALGFTTHAYRGTTADEAFGKARNFVSENPDVANQYAGYLSQFGDDPVMLDAMMKLTPNGRVMPLLVKDADIARARTNVPDYEMILDANQARSRFAAFDPARVNESDMLGRASPEFLGLLAAGSATGATVAALRNKKEDEKRKKDKDSAK